MIKSPLGASSGPRIWPSDRLLVPFPAPFGAFRKAWGLFRPQHFVDHSPYVGREELPPLPDLDALLSSGRASALSFATTAGDAVCFDARLVHASEGNGTALGQRRVALRYGGDDATYCERQGETAIPTREIDEMHGLRHGEPLSCEVGRKRGPRLAMYRGYIDYRGLHVAFDI